MRLGALVSVSLVLVMGLFAAACGGGGNDRSTPVASTASPAAQTTPLPDQEPGATPGSSIDLAEASPLLTVRTADAGDIRTGPSSLASGDFNGDGIGDLLIGLPFADGSDNAREDSGEAVVIFGRGSLEGEIDLARDEVGLHIFGALPGDNLGFGVAAGDLNGDGVDDVIVGAPGSNGLENIRTDLGEAYVIFGGPDLGGVVETAKTEQDFTLIAAEGFSRIGTSFAVADVNGDGLDDLVAGAPFAGREPGTPPGGSRTTIGEVYVVFGSPGLSGVASVAEDEQDLLISGARELDAFGQSVAAADVNGDSVADIIVGARGFDGRDGGRDAAGAISVFFGSSGLSGRLGMRDADFTVLGADAGDALGEVVASGDFNGDGLADILAVARNGDGPDDGRQNSGEVYFILGSASLSGTLDMASQEPHAVVYGVEPSALTATAVASGDLDGDGRDDVALGTALTPRSGRTRSGMVYVVFGRDLSGVIDLSQGVAGSLLIRGSAEGEALATGIVIDDFSGEGRPQLALAAANDQGPEEDDRGKIYVISAR